MRTRALSRRRVIAMLATVPVAGLSTWPKPTAASTPATVEENRYFSALSHNVPRLQVTISGEQHNVDFLGFYERTGDLTRWGYPTSEVMEETPGTLTQYYQRGVVDCDLAPENALDFE